MAGDIQEMGGIGMNREDEIREVITVLKIILDGRSEPEAWVFLEGIVAGVGSFYGYDGRSTAAFVELMADRFVKGDRDVPRVDLGRLP